MVGVRSMVSKAYWAGILVSCAVVGHGAEGYSPVANLTERWTNGTAGWIRITSGVYPATTNLAIEQSLALVFTNLNFLSDSSAGLAATTNSSGGRFIGNYSNSAIDYVVFDVKRIGLNNAASFQFMATNAHMWTYTFQLPVDNDTWESRVIPMTYSTDWKKGGAGTLDVFNVDRSCVSNIRVTVSWAYPDTSVQQLQIDNFKVVGPWEKGPFWADGVPKYWLVENGLTNQEGMATNDWDSDGFNNFGEYMAGTDPKDSNSLLRVTINKVASSNAVTLSWPRADYRTYKVLRNTNLTVTSFQQYTGSTYQAVGATNQMTIGGLTNGPKFFKVEVDK